MEDMLGRIWRILTEAAAQMPRLSEREREIVAAARTPHDLLRQADYLWARTMGTAWGLKLRPDIEAVQDALRCLCRAESARAAGMAAAAEIEEAEAREWLAEAGAR